MTSDVAYRTFLALNDADLSAPQEDMYLTILGLATVRLQEGEFAGFLRRHMRLAPGHRIHEAPPAYRRKRA